MFFFIKIYFPNFFVNTFVCSFFGPNLKILFYQKCEWTQYFCLTVLFRKIPLPIKCKDFYIKVNILIVMLLFNVFFSTSWKIYPGWYNRSECISISLKTTSWGWAGPSSAQLKLVRYLILRTPCEIDLEFQGSGVATALTQLMENSEPISPC